MVEGRGGRDGKREVGAWSGTGSYGEAGPDADLTGIFQPELATGSMLTWVFGRIFYTVSYETQSRKVLARNVTLTKVTSCRQLTV